MGRAAIEVAGHALKLTGSVDFDSVPGLVDRVKAFPEARVSAIDAAGVTRIDSAGLAFLVWCKRTLVGTAGAVVLESPPEQLVRLVNVTGMQGLFEMSSAA